MNDNPNMLALQAWGVFPNSCRRRRQAVRVFLGRSLFYLLAIALMWWSYWAKHFEAEVVIFWSWVLGAWLCILAPFQMEKEFSNARILRANLHDYLLAGMSRGRIITGIAAPQFAGVELFAAVLFVHTIAVLSAAWDSTPSPFVMFVCLFPFIFILIGGSYVSVLFWLKYPDYWKRVAATACLILTSPISVVLLIAPVLYHYFNFDSLLGIMMYSVAIELIACLPIRFGIAATIWDNMSSLERPVLPSKSANTKRHGFRS